MLMTVVILFSLSGCVGKTVYVQAQCPSVTVLTPVESIDINVTGGCVCGT